MPRQLPPDCLNEIFEYLGDEVDEVTLRSCLLVCRLWCEVSVRILWTNIQNNNTIIACLPNESKEILYKNKITILTPTSKPPLFNYVRFIKSISINKVRKIRNILKKNQLISFDNNKYIVVLQEMFKMFMNQISLKTLDFYTNSYFLRLKFFSIVPFTTYSGAVDCLRNLSELRFYSDVSSEIFYQLCQTCHNIESLSIVFEREISNGLSDLISVQQNLKYLDIFNDCKNFTDIIPLLAKLPNTLIKLDIGVGDYYMPLSFIAKFTNLQEIILTFDYHDEYFKNLHDVIFPQLQILKFKKHCPNHEYLTKFLENNGKGLKEIYLHNGNNSLNLDIAKFCPNLKTLYTGFKVDEIETLKAILNSCQQLESIETWCGHSLFGDDYLNENKLFEMVVKYSPKKFYELKMRYEYDIELLSEELESVFISWANHIPPKSLSLIIISEFQLIPLRIKEKSMEVIEKFKKLGVIKKFEIV